MMAVDVQVVLTMVTIITFQTQSANAWSKHPSPPSSKARHPNLTHPLHPGSSPVPGLAYGVLSGDAMECCPCGKPHGDEEKQVLNCEKAVTFYTDEANAKDEPMLWINLDRRLEVEHCHPNRPMKLCKALKFDAPFNDIQSYVKNHCINTISNPDTLRELTLKYCSYHSADEAVEMAYNCTTGCQLADQLNQNCRNLKPVVLQQPEISFSPDPVVNGEPFDVICNSNADVELEYTFVSIKDEEELQVTQDGGQFSDTVNLATDVTYTCAVSADGGDTFSPTSDPATPTVVPQQPLLIVTPFLGTLAIARCFSSDDPSSEFLYIIISIMDGEETQVPGASGPTVFNNVNDGDTFLCKVSADGGENFSATSDPTIFTVGSPP